jgi:pimeloyl-ACP methyl ester carboxylesterase
MPPSRHPARRWRISLAAALAVASVAAAGCSAIVPTAVAADGGSLLNTARPEQSASLTWVGCGDGLDCATVEVPQDHHDPDGPRLALSVTRHAATDPERRIGALMVNPGGPGAGSGDFVRSGVAVQAGAAGPYFGPDILARYDIIGMDSRGTGASAPVECFTDAQREQMLAEDVDVDLPGDSPGTGSTSRPASSSRPARRATTPPSSRPWRPTTWTRDMAEVATALGEEQISYLGLSYGTFLGATFATLFPDRVRHMVLDAPVDPVRWQTDPDAMSVEQARSAEEVLNRYLDTCAREGVTCGFGADRPAEAFDALVDRLEAEPLAVPAQGAVPAVRVDGATALVAARIAVFNRALCRCSPPG